MANIAAAFNVPFIFWEFSSEAVYYKGRYKIFINEDQSEQKQNFDYYHEFGHTRTHVGTQQELPTPFLQLQESQANYFAYHLAVPTFMLDRIRLPPAYMEAIRLICNTFNVEPCVAATRLEMYQNKQLERLEKSYLKRR